MYSIISSLPSSSGAFQNSVNESLAISNGSGLPGADGGSANRMFSLKNIE